MDDGEFQGLSNKDKAKVLGLKECDDGTTEWRIGDQVWFRPRRSRKWRQGRVTFSISRPARPPHCYRIPFVRVDWKLVGDINRTSPDQMCEHGYVPRFTLGNCPHPCPRCRRKQCVEEYRNEDRS